MSADCGKLENSNCFRCTHKSDFPKFGHICRLQYMFESRNSPMGLPNMLIECPMRQICCIDQLPSIFTDDALAIAFKILYIIFI